MAHTVTLVPGDGIGSEVSAAVMRAMTAGLAGGNVRTRDLGGSSTTTEFADAICHHIEYTGGARTVPV